MDRFRDVVFRSGGGGALSVWSHNWRPAGVAVALAALVLLYDGLLKHTPLGPLAMGGCRFLNVLLGMSAAAQPWMKINYLVAGGIGVYIVGVTWFARSEAEPQSRRGQLFLAMLVMFAGMAMLAYFPKEMPLVAGIEPQRLWIDWQSWAWCWALLAVLTGWRCLRCVFQPYSEFVQEAIRQCLVSLIIFDAALTFAVRGMFWGIAVVVLLIPMTILGRWSYST